MPLGDGVKERPFVKAVLSFIVPSLSEKSIKVLEDNEGAINLAANPLSSARTKHIDVRFHFIRELVRTGMIAVEHIPTKEQRADILTEEFVDAIFREHRNVLLNLHEGFLYFCFVIPFWIISSFTFFGLAPDDYYLVCLSHAEKDYTLSHYCRGLCIYGRSRGHWGTFARGNEVPCDLWYSCLRLSFVLEARLLWSFL